MYAVIAGGGTGGHVYPAIAIADALVERGHKRSDIHFIGSKRTLESTVVPAAGYEITLLPGRGIKRSLSISNVGAVVGLIVAFIKALGLLIRQRPQVVVSVGGYAAAPAVLTAIVLRIPLVLVESNAIPGAVHRLSGRFATSTAVAWPNTPLPRSSVTGNPVRSEFLAPTDRDSARDVLGIPHDALVIAIFGGSLGATTLNRAAVGMANAWTSRDDIFIYHVVGKRDWQDPSLRAADDLINYKAVQYENDMPSLFRAADVLISRSGATTTAEIAVVGIASILIPFPQATGDHQTKNAEVLERARAAVVIADRDCNPESLTRAVDSLITHPERLREMAAAAKTLAHPKAAAEVAEVIDRSVS